jgi:hypothetical protein
MIGIPHHRYGEWVCGEKYLKKDGDLQKEI